MSTKIQINSLEALERLIGNDNELEIQVRESVIQNFTAKHLKSIAKLDLVENIGKAVKEELQKEFFEIVKDGWGRDVVKGFKESVLKELKEDMCREARKILGQVISEAIDEHKTNEFIAEKLKYAAEHIEWQLSESVLTGRLEKMVDARIKERLGVK